VYLACPARQSSVAGGVVLQIFCFVDKFGKQAVENVDGGRDPKKKRGRKCVHPARFIKILVGAIGFEPTTP
jgi:hypothetical protein